MLELKFVCENIEEVKQRLSHRSGKFDLEGLSRLADERKTLIQDGETKKATKTPYQNSYLLSKATKRRLKSPK